MSEQITARQVRISLLAILLLAAILRFWGVSFGLPGHYRPDEEFLLYPAKHFLSGDLNPRFFIYPSLYMYVLSIGFFIFKLFGQWLELFAPVDFYGYVGQLMDAPLYFLARCTTAVFGVLGVWATFRLGKFLFGPMVGVLAAALLAVNFSHVRESHFATTDVAMTLLCTAALTTMLQVVRRGTVRDYLLAGAWTGLAISCKYTALALGIPFALAHCARLIRERKAPWHLPGMLDALLGLMVVCAAFAATSPFFLIEWELVKSNYAFQKPFIVNGFHGEGIDYGWPWLINFALPYGMGTWMCITAAIGAALSIFAFRSQRLRVLELLLPLSFAIALALVFVQGRWVFFRYVTPMTPIFAIFAAYFAWALGRCLSTPARSAALAAVVICFVSFDPLNRAVKFDQFLTKVDTREIARNWIDTHIPHDELILVHSDFLYGKPSYPVNHYLRYGELPSKQNFTAGWLIVDQHPVKYYCPKPIKAVQELIDDRGTLIFEIDPFKPDSAQRSIYDQHDAFFAPIAGFSDVERPGPQIRIYRLEDATRNR